MKVDLRGASGNVKKTSTVTSNNPGGSPVNLIMRGKVRSLIDVIPGASVYFRGRREDVSPAAIDLIGTSLPFHILKVESNIEGTIHHEIETLEDARKYRLKIANNLDFGNYGGIVKLITDLPQKSEIVVRVNGSIEGELRVAPETLLLGRLRAEESDRSGSVQVVSTRDKPFKITKLTYNERLIEILPQSIPGQAGFILLMTPKLEGLQPGTRELTTLGIETDLAPEEKHTIQIHVVNFSETAHRPAAR